MIDSPASIHSVHWPRATIVALAAFMPLAIWGIAVPLFGVDLQAVGDEPGTGQTIGPVLILTTATVASIAGWALLVVLERITPRARNRVDTHNPGRPA